MKRLYNIIKDSIKIVLEFEQLIDILYRETKIEKKLPIYYCEDASANSVIGMWGKPSVKKEL